MENPSKPEVGIIKQGRIKRLLSPSNKKLYVLIPFFIVIVGAIGYLVLQPKLNKDEVQTVTLPSEKTALANTLAKMKSNKPSETASLQEKATYYSRLFYVQYESKDYKGAGATFSHREKLTTEGLTYHDYFIAALVYKELGEKDKALAALDRAEVLVPADNSEEGFFRSGPIDSINYQRQELQK